MSRSAQRRRVAQRSLQSRVMGELLMAYGPAGSGKTGRLVEHAASRYQDDRFASTLVLVPTARHGDQFRRRLVARSGVALNLDVSTLARYARLHAAGRTLSRDVAADLLRRVSMDRIASGGAGRFEPIAEKPGLHALIAEAVAELVAGDVEPAAAPDHGDDHGAAPPEEAGDAQPRQGRLPLPAPAGRDDRDYMKEIAHRVTDIVLASADLPEAGREKFVAKHVIALKEAELAKLS